MQMQEYPIFAHHFEPKAVARHEVARLAALSRHGLLRNESFLNRHGAELVTGFIPEDTIIGDDEIVDREHADVRIERFPVNSASFQTSH